jgi:hypothetical protein
MPDTARRFGLRVNSKVDERFNVAKATRAATAYLSWLYYYFGDWPLAVAAYNCGEGTMKKALESSGSASLDALTAHCRAQPEELSPLKEETLRFVPQFAAAILFMKAKPAPEPTAASLAGRERLDKPARAGREAVAESGGARLGKPAAVRPRAEAVAESGGASVGKPVPARARAAVVADERGGPRVVKPVPARAKAEAVPGGGGAREGKPAAVRPRAAVVADERGGPRLPPAARGKKARRSGKLQLSGRYEVDDAPPESAPPKIERFP